MKTITFVTGSASKFHSAALILQQAGITPVQQALDIPEIQSENSEAIIRDKAQKAFELLGTPRVVTDDSWDIPGLRGFPGPYMKSMNHWLTPQNFLDLTRPLADRRVFLHQYLAYQDAHTQQVCMATMAGMLQTEARGSEDNISAARIISLQEDGKTIAEVRDSGASAIAHHHTAWHAFIDWFNEQRA